MTSDNEQDLQGLQAAGKVVGYTIAEMKRSVAPGMTTAELDKIGEELLERFGAQSAPRVTYDFPGSTCISINDEVAHGIPGPKVIQPGDLINIDVSAVLNGYYADAGVSFQLPPIMKSSFTCAAVQKRP